MSVSPSAGVRERADCRPTPYRYLPPLLFGLLALAWYLWGLDAKPIWGDEASTAWHSTYDASALWTQPITHKPPLYYLLTALFWSPGDGEFTLRLPAALLGATTVALAWPFGHLLGGRRLAFWLALLLLLSDIHLHYSQEARHYGLLSLGWLLSMIAAARLLQTVGSEGLSLLWWALGALLMAHAHPVGWLYLAVSQLMLWLVLPMGRPLPWRPLALTSVLTLLAMLTLAPWLHLALENAAGSFNWLRQPTLSQALMQWSALFGAKSLAHLFGVPLALATGGVLVLVSLAGMVSLLRRDARLGRWLLGLMLLTPTTLWLIGMVKPVYMLRTISPLHLLAVTGLALAITALPHPRGRTLAGLALAGLLATASWAWRQHYEKEDWRGLSGELAHRAGPNDAALVCENQLYRPLWFYLGNAMPRLFYPDRRKPRLWIWRGDERRWRPFRPMPGEAPPPTFWVIDRLGHCPRNIPALLGRLTGRRYRPGDGWHGHALTLTPWHSTSVRR